MILFILLFALGKIILFDYFTGISNTDEIHLH